MTNKLITLIISLFVMAITGCQIQPSNNPIAFSRVTGDYWQIWTMQPNGNNMQQVTSSAVDKRYPVWLKDDNELLFRTNNYQTFSLDIDNAEEKQICESFGLTSGAVPSPDGSKLLLIRFRTLLKDSGNLWLTEFESEKGKVVTRDIGLQYDPAFSPDGREIAYISSYGYRTGEIYIIDSDGKNKRKLTKNNAIELLPAFSPHSKTLAYVSDVTGDYEIWLMDTDGGNRRRLTDSKGIDTRPCWSPDGKKIMFVSNRSGSLQLWIMNSNGSDAQQLTTGPSSMDPAWR